MGMQIGALVHLYSTVHPFLAIDHIEVGGLTWKNILFYPDLICLFHSCNRTKTTTPVLNRLHMLSWTKS